MERQGNPGNIGAYGVVLPRIPFHFIQATWCVCGGWWCSLAGWIPIVAWMQRQRNPGNI
jgi:hypothetical protein